MTKVKIWDQDTLDFWKDKLDKVHALQVETVSGLLDDGEDTAEVLEAFGQLKKFIMIEMAKSLDIYNHNE